jgi:sec-independent protein translocase protein TatA
LVAFLQGIGAPELIIILVIMLLLFGAKKLPEMARSIGKSTKEFKKGMTEAASDDTEEEEEEAKSTPADKSQEVPTSG